MKPGSTETDTQQHRVGMKADTLPRLEEAWQRVQTTCSHLIRWQETGMKQKQLPERSAHSTTAGDTRHGHRQTPLPPTDTVTSHRHSYLPQTDNVTSHRQTTLPPTDTATSHRHSYLP